MTSRALFLAPLGLVILTAFAPATSSSPRWTVADSPPAAADGSARLRALARPTAAFDSLGKSVAAAGDVNGDGLSDYAVGAPGAGGTGQVLIYLGSSAGSFTLQATLTAGDATSGFGAAIAPAGDINGDGFDDLLVGQPTRNAAAGRVWVYLGSGGGIQTTASTVLDGAAPGEHFGSSVCTAGDVNQDGYDDIVVGAPYSNANGPLRGRAVVYLGSSTGLSGTSYPLSGGFTNSLFGMSVAGGCDVNGDGYDDVVVGAPTIGSDPGHVYLYGGSSSGMTFDPLHGDATNGVGVDGFGASVAMAGDYNGDGYADVAVGAPNTPFGVTPNCGKTYLVSGSAAGFVAPPTSISSDTQANAQLGASVGCAGDVNGDGFGDVISGEPLWDGPLGADQGRAFLSYGHRGSAMGPVTLSGFSAGSRFGAAVSGLGELKGSGFADLGIGAPSTSGGSGALFLFPGAATPTRYQPIAYASPYAPTDSSLMGTSVAMGDFNGDGFDDVVSGAPRTSQLAVHEGAVFYAPGHAGTAMELIGPVSSIHSGQTGSNFGSSVAFAGDVDGDGYSDLLVGAPDFPIPSNVSGKAFLFRGGPTGIDSVAAWSMDGQHTLDRFGACVSSAGDLNRDGYADIAVGAPDALNQAGVVQLYLGGSTTGGLATTPCFTITGAAPGDQLGKSIAAAGDVNKDGYDDVLIGAPGAGGNGKVYLVLGGTTQPFQSIAYTTGLPAGSRFGSSVAGMGDINGDGQADVAIGAPDAPGPGGDSTGVVEIRVGVVSGLTTFVWQSFTGAHAGDLFGSSVAFGDLNADGLSDLGVGAPGFDGTQVNQGAVYLYPAFNDGTGMLSSTPTTLLRTNSNSVGHGFSLAMNGDLNGDGLADVVDGLPAATFAGPQSGVFELAAGGGLIDTRERIERMARTFNGTPVALEGLAVGGNGFAIGMRARTPAGRKRVTPQFQAGDLFQPISNFPLISGVTTMGGAPDTNGVSFDTWQQIFSFAPWSFVRWHARVKTHSPWFAYTPWLTPSGNAPALGDVVIAPAGVAVDPRAEGGSIALAVPEPTPAQGTQTMAFRLAESEVVDLSVYDVRGRLVRRLAEGQRRAGPQSVVWDGTDASDTRVPGGIYFARLATKQDTRVRQFVRLP